MNFDKKSRKLTIKMKIDKSEVTVRRFALYGFLLLIFSVVFASNVANIYNLILKLELVINPNKPYAYNLWKDTPFPISMDIYFFNWTNPKDINTPGVKPRLHEMGPYRFRENKTKVDIVWHDNGTITFKQLKYWYFDAEYSVGSIDDQITSLNPVAIAALAQAKNFNYFLQKAVSVSMRALVQDIHITKTVGEIIFDGYEEPLFSLAKTFPKLLDSIAGIEMPPFNKFGWFVERNGSKDIEGIFTMGTGEKDVKFGQLYEWNYQKKTQYYSGECSQVRGSAGEFFPQNLPRDEIELFFSDMCRSIKLEFESEDEFSGISAYKFVGGDKTFDNGTKYPENACYCEGQCVRSGLASVSKCKFGAPGYISFPHFYQADPWYAEQFEGLKPDKEKHEFYVLLEPRTGIPLHVNGKFQANLLMEPNSNIVMFSNVPRLFFPVFWFQELVSFPEEVSIPLKLLLVFPTLCYVMAGGCLLLGLLLLTPTAFLFRDRYLRIQKPVIKKLSIVEYCKEMETYREDEEAHLPLTTPE